MLNIKINNITNQWTKQNIENYLYDTFDIFLYFHIKFLV